MSDEEISKLFGVSKKEIKRQLEMYKGMETKDIPLQRKDPLQVATQGGEMILEDKETLKLIRRSLIK